MSASDVPGNSRKPVAEGRKMGHISATRPSTACKEKAKPVPNRVVLVLASKKGDFPMSINSDLALFGVEADWRVSLFLLPPPSSTRPCQYQYLSLATALLPSGFAATHLAPAFPTCRPGFQVWIPSTHPPSFLHNRDSTFSLGCFAIVSLFFSSFPLAFFACHPLLSSPRQVDEAGLPSPSSRCLHTHSISVETLSLLFTVHYCSQLIFCLDLYLIDAYLFHLARFSSLLISVFVSPASWPLVSLLFSSFSHPNDLLSFEFNSL
ncbi:hypothetical protein R3P38DRAFT_3200203 [Favolaschia claudopus]|uniref:Uncharacterized protein n=1 Tax=Favolaschia claudopus TaxID=2862362 RepID=A0AAW0AZP7_9AGAR